MKRVPLAEDDPGGGVLSNEWGSGLVCPRGVCPVLGEGGAPKGLAEADEDGPVAEVARRIGADPGEVLAGAAAPETKEAHKAATAEAV